MKIDGQDGGLMVVRDARAFLAATTALQMEETMMERHFSDLHASGFMMSKSREKEGTIQFQSLCDGDAATIYYAKDRECYANVRFIFKEDVTGSYRDHVVASDANDAVKAAGLLIASELQNIANVLKTDGLAKERFSAVPEDPEQAFQFDSVADFGSFSVSFCSRLRPLVDRIVYNVVSKSGVVNLQFLALASSDLGEASSQIADQVEVAVENVKSLFGVGADVYFAP